MTCLSIIAFWLMVILGFYTYELFGLVTSFFVFFAAALLRGSRNKLVGEEIRSSSKWQLIFSVYYISLLPLAFLALQINYRIDELNGTRLALIFSFPLLVMVLLGDIKACKSGNKVKL
jgi:hypothetical protein